MDDQKYMDQPGIVPSNGPAILTPSQLAAKMLEWEHARLELDALEKQIADQVLLMGKTYVVGNVRATFSKARHTYDYEGAGQAAPPEVIEKYTEQVTNWYKVCKEAEIPVVGVVTGAPSVTLKLEG